MTAPVPATTEPPPPAPVARPTALLTLVTAVGVLGAAVVVAGLAGTVSGGPVLGPYLVLVVATTLLTDVTAIDLRVGRHAESYTWSEMSIVLGLALLPVDHLLVTTLALGVAYLATGQPVLKWTLNVGSYAVGLALAALVCRAITVPTWEAPLLSAVALLAGAATWAVWNKVTIDTAIALAQGRPLLAVLRSELASTAVVFACNVGLAFTCLGLGRTHPLLLAAAPACIVLAALLNRWYLHLVQDRAAWRALETASRELTALDEQVLAEVALSRVRSLMQADGAELRLTNGTSGAARHGVVHRLRHGEITRGSENPPLPVQPTVTVARGEGVAGLPVERTEASVALDGPDERLGSLVVQYDGAVRLSRRERSQLTAYAGALTAALCNARLHAQVRRQADLSAYAALHDALTGLPNRALLQQEVDAALADRRPFALLLLDLDRFKPVNDTHGHEAGDEVLRVVATRLSAAVRPTDVVGRLGGDEFALLLHDARDVGALVRRLQALVAVPVDVGDAAVTVGASVGQAMGPCDGSSFAALLRVADEGMYRGKRARPSAVPQRSAPLAAPVPVAVGAVPAQSGGHPAGGAEAGRSLTLPD